MEWGGDPTTIYPAIKALNDQFDALGLIFDTDPRRTSKTGVAQKVEEEATADDDDDAATTKSKPAPAEQQERKPPARRRAAQTRKPRSPA